MRTTTVIGVAIISSVGWVVPFGPSASATETDVTRDLETLVRQADFDAAEAAAQKLLRSGSLSRQEVARVYLQLGIVASAKRESANAEAAFRKAIGLGHDMLLSSSVGPHVAETFARVKAALPASASVPPTIELTASPETGELSVAVPARLEKDAGLVQRILVTIADSRETRDLGNAPVRFALPLPESVAACTVATAAVVDEFGNMLWPAVASADVCRPPSPVLASNGGNVNPAPAVVSPMAARPTVEVLSTQRSPSTATPISRATWVAAAMTGAAAVGTTVLGLGALERRDDYNASFGNDSTPNQMRGLREAALTAEHRATAGAIVTALLATATVAFYIKGRF